MNLEKLRISRSLLAWYDKSRRDLPWRVHPGQAPNPYHVLISETMLQQTQVRTVIPYFHKFIRSWPTLRDLAAADEQAVLLAWQGLGYYSRARNLLATVRQIAQEHAGQIPRDVDTLLKLPGIGRYTAGAIASIAYDTAAPILDGNVTRVLCRLDAIRSDPRDRATLQLLWRRAADILPQQRVGDFNSALMELGATVCTPRSPQCLICPIHKSCKAFSAGLWDVIPAPKRSRPVPLVQRTTLCLHHGRNGASRWLIEQRPLRGRWAGMWQFVTVETDGQAVTAATVRAAAGVKSGVPQHIGQIQHSLTHRKYQFNVYRCDVRSPNLVGKPDMQASPRKWVTLSELSDHPLPRPHLRIAELLTKLQSGTT
jgi:A/G-specific adenine glycosylase